MKVFGIVLAFLSATALAMPAAEGDLQNLQRRCQGDGETCREPSDCCGDMRCDKTRSVANTGGICKN